MSELTDTEAIARVLELDKAATAGPCTVSQNRIYIGSDGIPFARCYDGDGIGWSGACGNAVCLAEYRTLAPRLATLAQAQAEEIARLKGQLNSFIKNSELYGNA